MPRANVAFIHASPLAIEPLKTYYAAAEPEWTITNLWDDGILRLFRSNDQARIEAALASLLDHAAKLYASEAALITCSAARLELIDRLRERSRIPIVKIDSPMAEAAVTAASKIGALVTFAPTVDATVAMLRETAQAAGREVQVESNLVEGAFERLFAGDTSEHDRLVRRGAERLRDAGAGAIVLAQVSMAHLRAELEKSLGLPVYSSLETSHAALGKSLGY
jgi:Asp/Glu/hydantoin racemase